MDRKILKPIVISPLIGVILSLLFLAMNGMQWGSPVLWLAIGSMLCSLYTAYLAFRQPAGGNDQLSIAGTAEYMQALRSQRHEFLNHLQVIWGYIQLQKTERAISYICEVSTGLMEAGKIAKIKSTAISSLLFLRLSQAKDRGINFSFSVESDLADLPQPDKVSRIVNSLLEAAFAAVDKASLAQKTVFFKTAKNNDEYVIEIASEVLLAQPTLGLNTVQKLARELGGQIVPVSAGKMSAIRFFIPCKRARYEEVNPVSVQVAEPGRKNTGEMELK